MSNSQFLRLQHAADRLRQCYAATEMAESALMEEVQMFLAENRGGVREIARKMGFSPQYVCDVQHGRRKISPQFLEKLKHI